MKCQFQSKYIKSKFWLHPGKNIGHLCASHNYWMDPKVTFHQTQTRLLSIQNRLHPFRYILCKLYLHIARKYNIIISPLSSSPSVGSESHLCHILPTFHIHTLPLLISLTISQRNPFFSFILHTFCIPALRHVPSNYLVLFRSIPISVKTNSKTKIRNKGPYRNNASCRVGRRIHTPTFLFTQRVTS